MNLKELISGVKDYHLEAVAVPEWNTTVHLREVTVADRGKLFKLVDGKQMPDTELYAHVLLYCICDENGKRAFGDEDYDLLASKNAKVIRRLGTQAIELNLMTPDAVDDAKKN